MDSIKDVVQSSVKVPEFNKHIGQNVEITIKMKAIVRKHLMIKKLSIFPLRLRDIQIMNENVLIKSNDF